MQDQGQNQPGHEPPDSPAKSPAPSAPPAGAGYPVSPYQPPSALPPEDRRKRSRFLIQLLIGAGLALPVWVAAFATGFREERLGFLTWIAALLLAGLYWWLAPRSTGGVLAGLALGLVLPFLLLGLCAIFIV